MLRKLSPKPRLQNKKENHPFIQVNSKDTRPLSKDLTVNLEAIKGIFAGTSDIVIREFKIGAEQQVKAFLVMISGLVNEASVNENLMHPLMFIRRDINKSNAFTIIKESALSVANVKEFMTLQETVDALSGEEIPPYSLRG